MKKVTSLLLLIVSAGFCFGETILAEKRTVKYCGGDSRMEIEKDTVGGHLTITTERIIFEAYNRDRGSFEIPVEDIKRLAVGEWATRRVARAVTDTLLLGPAGLVHLFRKKPQEMLLIEYSSADEDSYGAPVFFYETKKRIKQIEEAAETATGLKIVREAPPTKK